MTSYPIALFDSVKDGTVQSGGMWGCLHQCRILPHQRTGNDSTDLIGLTGGIVGYLDLGFRGTQLIPFTWSYKMCAGPASEQRILLWTLGSILAPEIERGESCPTLTTKTHTGVTRVVDGNLTLQFDDTYNGDDNVLRYFVGDFKLSLTPPSASSAGIVSPTLSSDSTISSINSGTSTQTSTSTGSLDSIPPFSISWNGYQTQAASIGGPSPSQIPNEATGIISTNTIVGIAIGVTGGVVILLLVALILIRRRRRQRSIKEGNQVKNKISPWMRETNDQPTNDQQAEWDRTRNEKAVPLDMEDSHQRIVFTKPPAFNTNVSLESTRETLTSAEARLCPTERVPPRPQSPLTGDPISPNPTVVTALPPSYDMHPYHQVVTPRIDEDDYSSVDDIGGLRDWAESHRDVIPVDLERRLRAGGFVPTTNPRDISKDVWERTFKVTTYELRGLQELYDVTQAGLSGS